MIVSQEKFSAGITIEFGCTIQKNMQLKEAKL